MKFDEDVVALLEEDIKMMRRQIQLFHEEAIWEFKYELLVTAFVRVHKWCEVHFRNLSDFGQDVVKILYNFNAIVAPQVRVVVRNCCRTSRVMGECAHHNQKELRKIHEEEANRFYEFLVVDFEKEHKKDFGEGDDGGIQYEFSHPIWEYYKGNTFPTRFISQYRTRDKSLIDYTLDTRLFSGAWTLDLERGDERLKVRGDFKEHPQQNMFGHFEANNTYGPVSVSLQDLDAEMMFTQYDMRCVTDTIRNYLKDLWALSAEAGVERNNFLEQWNHAGMVSFRTGESPGMKYPAVQKIGVIVFMQAGWRPSLGVATGDPTSTVGYKITVVPFDAADFDEIVQSVTQHHSLADIGAEQARFLETWCTATMRSFMIRFCHVNCAGEYYWDAQASEEDDPFAYLWEMHNDAEQQYV